MKYFNCDYNEGAHPKILEALQKSNFEQTEGYGMDIYCKNAAEIIKAKCNREDLDVHFLVGGTQTNLTVVSAALRPHQGVLCAETGHVNLHETGAIEATGHKVIVVPSKNGKLCAAEVLKVYKAHWNDDTHEHIVQPKMVYISNPTEVGTIYSKQELADLYSVCKDNGLYLYVDGARLGYGLCAEGNDLDLPTLASLCDVFYIGGTKIGALFGEALVIRSEGLKEDFRYILKQKGGMLAKGRLLGIQFKTLFTDDLYFKMSIHANNMAKKIKEALLNKDIKVLIDSNTNQQFPILNNSIIEKLKKKYNFAIWQKVDQDNTAVRFCTSWATKEEDVEQLINDIKKLI